MIDTCVSTSLPAGDSLLLAGDTCAGTRSLTPCRKSKHVTTQQQSIPNPMHGIYILLATMEEINARPVFNNISRYMFFMFHTIPNHEMHCLLSFQFPLYAVVFSLFIIFSGDFVSLKIIERL